MNELEKMFWHSFAGINTTNYPPYNIIRRGNDFVLEFGVAGFSKDELNIDYDGKTLEVTGTKPPRLQEELVEYVHHSLAKRNFKQTIAVRGHFDVGDVCLENGVLTINMTDKTERIKPIIRIRDPVPMIEKK